MPLDHPAFKTVRNIAQILFYRKIGTEAHLSKRTLSFHCADCGHRIPWHRLIWQRGWKYCACDSCDKFTRLMVSLPDDVPPPPSRLGGML